MADFYSLVASGSVFYFLLVFIAFSYGIVALMTWSALKPLKYLGFPTIVVGIFCLILYSGFNELVPELIEDVSANMADIIIEHGKSYFLISSIVTIIIGALMEVIYFSVASLLKKKKTLKENKEDKNQE